MGGHQADVAEQGARRASCGRSMCPKWYLLGAAIRRAMARFAGLLRSTHHLLQPFRPVAKGLSGQLSFRKKTVFLPVAEAKKVNRVDRWHISCNGFAMPRVRSCEPEGSKVMTQGALSGALLRIAALRRVWADVRHWKYLLAAARAGVSRRSQNSVS
jgi:hypothetical protein